MKNWKSVMVYICVGRWMWHKLCKYWILACAALFLLIALQEAVIFRIIYMALFLCFVITFQVGQLLSEIIVKHLWPCLVIMMKTAQIDDWLMVMLICIYWFFKTIVFVSPTKGKASAYVLRLSLMRLQCVHSHFLGRQTLQDSSATVLLLLH